MIIKSFEVQRKISSFSKNNLFLLYGENNGLKKDIKDIIKNSFEKEKSNLEIFSAYENYILDNEENFYNTIYSGSLFGDKKIIIINEGTDKILKILEDIINKKPENILIIIYSSILEKKSKLRTFFEKEKTTICIPCYPDNERDLENIAKHEFKNNNVIIQREALSLLIEKSNQDRGNLKNEIEKIISYAHTKKNLELDEIRALINFAGEHKSDNLVNECLCGNITQFKKILSEVYSSTLNQIFLLRILSNKIQKLIKIKLLENDYKNIDSLIDEARPAIFWKDKPIIKKQITIWNINALNNIINEINTIEILCKKKPQLAKIISFNFFGQICIKASNYS